MEHVSRFYDFTVIDYSLLGTVLAMLVGVVMILLLLVLQSMLKHIPENVARFVNVNQQQCN